MRNGRHTDQEKGAIKQAVRQRDGMQCTRCGMTNEDHQGRFGVSLHIHRLQPGSQYSLEGCITLCASCHAVQPKRARHEKDVEREEKIEVRAETEWIERLDVAARRMGLTRSAYVRLIITQRMDQDGIPFPSSQKEQGQ